MNGIIPGALVHNELSFSRVPYEDIRYQVQFRNLHLQYWQIFYLTAGDGPYK